MKKLLSLALLLAGFQLFAQDEKLHNYDWVYQDNIITVKFHLDGLVLSYPIIDLNSSGQLRFSFDDLDADVKNYFYTLQLCNADWTPTDLTEMEYLRGFSEDRIDTYHYSFSTRVPYTHYELLLPNNDMAWTRSGNYLLKVYEDNGGRKLVITRRFMVVDPLVQITPRVTIPNMVSKARTHQEIDFTVNHEKLDIRNPRSEIRAVVLQNGRWDNAITGIEPLFIRQTELIFDYQNKIVFPAGKEFRYFDMRSLKYRLDNIAAIEEFDDGYEVDIVPDKKRSNEPHLYRDDTNGKFVIEHLDQPGGSDLRSDYADVLFTLYSPAPIEGGDVYLFGAFSDWRPRPEYKMIFNPAINSYVCKALLKQGYYDYQYVVVKPTGEISIEDTEGNWYETENDYTILIYYHPFAARYDQLIAAFTFDSTRN